MAKITNNTRSTMDFITGVKDGVAVTEGLMAGETKEIVLMDPNDPTVRGRALSGAISIDGGTGGNARIEPEAPPAAEKRSAATLSGEVGVRG